LDGIGFELQSDSIEGDGSGIQTSNTSSIPLDLTTDERLRLATEIASVGGNPFDNFRLAMGLYYRGYSSDGKNFVERLSGQNAAISDFITNSGVRGIAFVHWSPAPYWKKRTISGTTYRGSTTTFVDPVADPSGYNTITRTLLQGGGLDHPDKATDPTGYATWMDDFTNAVLADMEYVHQNIGPIVKFCPQNEPASATPYPSCVWTDQEVYDFLKAIVPKIRASLILSTGNTVDIYLEESNGAALVKADADLLAEIWGRAWHLINETANDADYMRTNAATFVAAAAPKVVFTDESEYFDQVIVGDSEYKPPEYRFANTVLMPMTWFLYLNSPIWYWIHIGKPTTGPHNETLGRALTVWRPPGSPVSSNYPALAEGQFTTVDVNWNAIKPWLSHMPSGSVRLDTAQSVTAGGLGVMAWRKPDGNTVIAIVNRTATSKDFRIVVPGHTGTFNGLRYDVASVDQDVGQKSISGSVFRTTVPAYSAEFWTGTIS
jgi:hypothetical protein